MATKQDLKKFILANNLAPAEAVKKAAKQAEGDDYCLADLLLQQGVVNDDTLRRIKAYILGIPFIDLKKVKVERAVLELIPESVARQHNIVAFNKSSRGLEVAMLDPEDIVAIDFIRKSAGLEVLSRLTDIPSIKQVLRQYQKSLKDEFSDIKEVIERESAAMAGGEAELSEKDLKKMATDLPVIRILETLISHAFLQKASDIHIEPYDKELVIRYRIDGLLHDAMTLPKRAAAGVVARVKVLAGLRLDEKRLPQDGRFKLIVNDEAVSFRVSILPTYYGEKVVMRLLPDTIHGLTIEELGFHNEGLELLHQAVRSTTGMILATGPTGSGKTTTLYSLLNLLNTPDVNISTIEDPIEYQIPRITQTQVRPDIGFTFANGLRSLVRQDPDIIMVGEIRDQETADLAVNAALTGHLVLSTIHTNSAAGTVPRLLDMGVEPFLLVSTINVVIGQRLVRRLRPEREEYHLSADELKSLGESVDLDRMLKILRKFKVISPTGEWSEVTFYRAKPSGEHDGYEGRIGIHEVLAVTPAIKELIVKSGVGGDEIETQAKKDGMLSMLEDGIYKSAIGVTSIEEVLRVVTE
ncbi:MAG: GspE/PulE family protein [bacterium]|nr:GspE/PulE family protein [bacterium]